MAQRDLEKMLRAMIREEVGAVLLDRAPDRSEEDATAREWLTSREAADYLRLSPKTLANLRGRPDGPPFEKRGRLIRYRSSALRNWMTSGS